MERRRHFALYGWILVLLGASLLAPASALGLEVGQRVLARGDIQSDIYHYPARVEAVQGREVRVRYDDGTQATIPAAAIVERTLIEGDLVRTADGVAAVVRDGPDERVTVRPLQADAEPVEVPRAGLRALLRTDRNLGRRPFGGDLEPGARVMAKWDERAWYPGTVRRVQGEALLIAFDDESWLWVPNDHTVPAYAMRPGVAVLGINPRDGQPMPAEIVSISEEGAQLRFFDETVRKVPLDRLVAFLDHPNLDFGDLCRRALGPDDDPREHAATLYGWMTPLHYYHDAYNVSRVDTSPERLELSLVLWLPKDRRPREGWKQLLEVLAAQTRAFLARELEVPVEAKVYGEPVVGEHALAWYRDNLRESDAWHVWQPTGESVKRAFPGGPKAGRHRVVVVIPDAPGISSDSSGSERGMGFVRANGAWFEDLTLEGLRAIERDPGETSFDGWQADFLASTLAHEALHTLGVPHTDGDPWSIMNIGPWYPITRPEVHMAELHKIVLRSPFRRSLSLSQGYALYLLDHEARYLRTIAATPRADSRLLLLYGRGRGLFRLRETLASFGPDGACRSGDRTLTGDRNLCRAYLASFVHYLVERYGPDALEALFEATDADAADVAAGYLGVSVRRLEADWRGWLHEQVTAPAGVGKGD